MKRYNREMEWLIDLLFQRNGLLLFVVIGLGYLIGKVGWKGFSLGPVAGVLMAGILFGHFGLRLSPGAQSVGFALFIFAVGYQSGSGFVQVLKRDGLKYLALSLLVTSSGMIVAVVSANLLELAPGMSAGLLAGGLTSSPTLAAAQDAVESGAVSFPSDLEADDVVNNISTTYAITYIFGLTGLIILIKLIPFVFRINYAQETVILQMSLGSGTKKSSPITLRTYMVGQTEFLTTPVGRLRERHWDGRTAIRIFRDGHGIRLEDDEIAQQGDIVQMIGPAEYLMSAGPLIGKELNPEISSTNMSLETVQIVVTSDKAPIQELKVRQFGPEYGVVLLNIFRKGEPIAFSGDTNVLSSDVLTLMGFASEIDIAGAHLGYIEREGIETDMVTFTFGIAIGIIIGAISVTLFGVSLGLGSAGGLLVSGLFIGHRRSVRPTFGRLPAPARWFLMEFGLLAFMAGVGLRAGGSFFETLMDSGFGLIGSGMIVTLVPVVLGYTFGRYLLRLNPVLLLGALTGAMTSGACLGVALKEADSPLPALGYTGTYAFSNILLVMAGSLIFLWS